MSLLHILTVGVVGYVASGLGPDCQKVTHGGDFYTLLWESDTTVHGCKDSRVYQKDNSPGSRFCFKTGGAIERHCAETFKFMELEGSLTMVAAGDFRNGVWGVLSPEDSIWYRGNLIEGSSALDGPWEKVDGSLSYISVGKKGEVYGVNQSGSVMKREGAGETLNPIGTHWTQVPAPKFTSLSVFNGQIWGIRYDYSIWALKNDEFVQVEGLLKVVSVGMAGVWGVDSVGNIWYRQGTKENPESIGYQWKQESGSLRLTYIEVPVTPAPLLQTVEVWGIDFKGQIWRKQFLSDSATNWFMVGGTQLKQLNVAEFRLWGVALKDFTIWTTNIIPGAQDENPCSSLSSSPLIKNKNINCIGVQPIPANNSLFASEQNIDGTYSTNWTILTGGGQGETITLTCPLASVKITAMCMAPEPGPNFWLSDAPET